MLLCESSVFLQGQQELTAAPGGAEGFPAAFPALGSRRHPSRAAEDGGEDPRAGLRLDFLGFS